MKTESTDTGTLETWTPEEVNAALETGDIVLIDVRTPQEYMVEHVHGAFLMPMAFFRAETLPGETEKKIVFHCGSGVRSERVARMVLASGRDTVRHMGGGMAGWKQAGIAYIGTDMATGAPKRTG
ncbi:rhodanese-like domain-containing protein [Roseisalinus antarcticus]|uniref:Inner membrane protein YgaP n=1 Tax=Roseisalinus antarcticus TaxID=254357 RepID=A0A1Y5T890_9RHOB|nr:rhodanese-like domain-containing protein [Roseisalinus antarcticus]SLN57941.1 Inner membrane protein YgaP [Roseisalinus antarcticus]